MAAHFPGAEWRLDKQLWVARFGNESEILVLRPGRGRPRREGAGPGARRAVLQREFANPGGIRGRLPSPVSRRWCRVCRRKPFHDANPPSRRSWLHSLFVEKVDPDRHQRLVQSELFGWLLMNPNDNRENLSAEYLADLDALDDRRRIGSSSACGRMTLKRFVDFRRRWTAAG